jgi:hypothetical protein
MRWIIERKVVKFLDPVGEFPFRIITKIYCKFNILCVPRTKWEAVLWQGRLYVSVTQVKFLLFVSPYLYSFFGTRPARVVMSVAKEIESAKNRGKKYKMVASPRIRAIIL